MSGPYSVELKNALTCALFDVDRSGHAVKYKRKPGHAPIEFNETWAVHGVCSKCETVSIMVGRCVECGTVYSDPEVKGIAAENMVAEQCRLARYIIRQVNPRHLDPVSAVSPA